MHNQYTSETLQDKINRFWSKVNKDGSIPAHMPHLGKCWEWMPHCTQYGYGQTRWFGEQMLSHRISWELTYGVIQDGLFVLHKCDNRRCVNPEHLFLGIHQDNIDDKMRKERQAKGETHYKVKLTKEQVIEIRKRYAAGNISHRDLATEYHVWKSTISVILNRKTWKHI